MPLPIFITPIYQTPTGVVLGRVPISRFSGQPISGLLTPVTSGLVFFSPVLLEQLPNNEIDLDYIRVVVNSNDVYTPPVVENSRLFTFGPNSSSRTNQPKWRTQPKEYTAIGGLVDETLLITLANDLRAQYEAHRASAVFHVIADGINTITSPAAVSLATATTLLNELKLKFDLHRTQPGVHSTDDVIDEILTANADGNPLPAAFLANELKLKYNVHRTAPLIHVVNDGINIVTAADPSVISKLI